MASAAFLSRRRLFPLVAGVTDGILTALTLASGRLFAPAGGVGVGLAFRIAIAASLSGMFIFFTAEYARLRGELVEAGKQLNLTSHGRLATTQLGKAVRSDAASAALLSSACNFLGAIFPLILGVVFPVPRWLPIAVSVIALGLLGAALAHSVYGSMIRWSLALMISGLILAFIGVEIHIV